jgi:hypothetical protein
VDARTLVMAGDDDAVSAEHTLHLYRGIPYAELAVPSLPARARPIRRTGPGFRLQGTVLLLCYRSHMAVRIDYLE